MSIQLNYIGSRALNPRVSAAHDNRADDAEYKRLRAAASHEHDIKSRLLGESQQAYQTGDGARAKELSNEAKQHDQAMDRYNEQAAEYVFRANNAYAAADEIDLHGLFAEEAERIMEMRIQACIQRRESHLHVIVGKGSHSPQHIQKLKPTVERLCQQHNFQYRTEENEGRILITFAPGAPSYFPSPPQQQPYGGYPQQQSYNAYPQQQPYQQPHYQQSQGGNGELQEVIKNAPKIIRMLRRMCCEIM